MEDSFRVRVDNVFGSLSSSSSQPLTLSLWSLTDEEIEKRSWNRQSDSPADDDDEDTGVANFPTEVDRLFLAAKGKLGLFDGIQNPNPNPNPGYYRKELEDDLQDLDEDAADDIGGEGVTSSRSHEAVDDQEEELDVRNSIGMDCTLDLEEEEDAYDKVAVGREETNDDHLYMRAVTDYAPDMDSYNKIPNSFKEVPRDPRANHSAATLRLKEDAEAAKGFKSLHVFEQTVTVMSDTQNFPTRKSDSLHASKQTSDVVSDFQNNTLDDEMNLKSILKRKEGQVDSKSEKRVRFEPSCKNIHEEETEVSDGEISLHTESSSEHQDPSLVPDYILNPSRYTHYMFDSLTDINEESNCQAYADFLNMIKKSKQSEPEEVPADLSKPVIFNPKKKATSNETSSLSKEVSMAELMLKKSLPISLTEFETCEMEVDNEREILPEKVGNGRRGARQYRSKQSLKSIEYDS